MTEVAIVLVDSWAVYTLRRSDVDVTDLLEQYVRAERYVDMAGVPRPAEWGQLASSELATNESFARLREYENGALAKYALFAIHGWSDWLLRYDRATGVLPVGEVLQRLGAYLGESLGKVECGFAVLLEPECDDKVQVSVEYCSLESMLHPSDLKVGNVYLAAAT